jgi:O-antigen/teichoic acid export membrane protein
MSSPSKNIFWLTLSRVIALIFLGIAYIFLFRYLGTYRTGQHQFVLAYVTIFGIIVDFGIQQYVIKKISEDTSRVKTYFHHFFAIEVVLATLVYLVLVGTAYFNGYEPLVRDAIMLAGLGMVANALTYPFLSVMSAFHDLRKVALINFLNSLVNIIIIFSAIIFNRSIVFLVSNQLIFGLLGIYLYSRFVRRYLPRLELWKGVRSLNWHLIRNILIAAVPFALLVSFSTIYNRIDMVLITKFLGYEQTGLYAAAYKFFDLIAFFPSVVSFSVYPVFTTLMAKRDLSSVRAMIEKYLRAMIALALPMAVAGSLLAKPIITLLAGKDFDAAAPVLSVLVFAPAALFIYIIANALVVSQLTRFAVWVTGMNVLVNVLGNILLLPKIGIMGAAIMTVASECMQGLFYFYLVRKRITIFTWQSFSWQPFLASMVMASVLWYMQDVSLLLSIPIGACVYGGSLFALQFFEPGDIEFLRTLIRKK